MVIELSRVQFGLKSSACWNHKYNLRPNLYDTSVQLPLYFTHFEIAQLASTCEPLNFIGCYYFIFILMGWKRMQFRGENSAIRE